MNGGGSSPGTQKPGDRPARLRVEDLGVDLPPAGICVDEDLLPLQLERPGGDDAVVAPLERHEAVRPQPGQRQGSGVLEVAGVDPHAVQLVQPAATLVLLKGGSPPEAVVVAPDLAVVADDGLPGHQQLPGVVGLAVVGFDPEEDGAVGDPLPVVEIAGDAELHLVDAVEVGLRRGVGAEGVEQHREADVEPLVGEHGHVVDLGDVVFAVDRGRE